MMPGKTSGEHSADFAKKRVFLNKELSSYAIVIIIWMGRDWNEITSTTSTAKVVQINGGSILWMLSVIGELQPVVYSSVVLGAWHDSGVSFNSIQGVVLFSVPQHSHYKTKTYIWI